MVVSPKVKKVLFFVRGGGLLILDWAVGLEADRYRRDLVIAHFEHCNDSDQWCSFVRITCWKIRYCPYMSALSGVTRYKHGGL